MSRGSSCSTSTPTEHGARLRRQARRDDEYHRSSIVSDLALQLEAGVVARRLIGRDPADAERIRYAEAVSRRALPFSDREQRLWQRILARPLLFNAVDGALALVEPTSPIRQRGYIMLAVLEASPEHTDLFLARERARWLVVISVLGAAIVGGLRALLGLLVIAATR
jgi:hypothetical protein